MTWLGRALIASVALPVLVIGGAAAALTWPELLWFPYHARIGAHDVYAERPIDAATVRAIARADALLGASPIHAPGLGARIVLTRGGWRWRLLSVGVGDSFGLTRALNEAVVIGRNDPARDRVFSDRRIANQRVLSGTIAHEITHTALRRRYGMAVDMRVPVWKREGYCDHVARDSALDDATARRLIAERRTAPGLLYWQGRRRVAATLAANGGSVDALFAADGVTPQR